MSCEICLGYRSNYHVVTILLTLLGVKTSCMKENEFRLAKGYKIIQGTQLNTAYSKGMSSVYCSSICSSDCISATFSVKYQTCITFLEKFYNSTLVWIKDPDWAVLYRKQQRAQFGDWTLVFRAQKEVNISLYDVWTDTGRYDDLPLSRDGVLDGCYRLDNLGDCKGHFRSSILDNWKYIKEVKFAVYVNDSEVSYIVFNGSQTTRDVWFFQSNILNSSWPNIKIDGNIRYFEIPGYPAYPCKRRFEIYSVFSGCLNDKAYFLAVDTDWDSCAIEWKLDATNFPVFMYSKMNWIARFGSSPSEYMLADFIVVLVKF